MIAPASLLGLAPSAVFLADLVVSRANVLDQAVMIVQHAQ